MDPDGAAANLIAVQYKVIGLGTTASRIALDILQVFIHRGGKGVMNGGPPFFFLVPFKKRKIGDPYEIEHILVQEPQDARQVIAQLSEGIVDYFRFIGNKEEKVPFTGIKSLVHGGHLLGG